MLIEFETSVLLPEELYKIVSGFLQHEHVRVAVRCPQNLRPTLQNLYSTALSMI